MDECAIDALIDLIILLLYRAYRSYILDIRINVYAQNTKKQKLKSNNEFRK